MLFGLFVLGCAVTSNLAVAAEVPPVFKPSDASMPSASSDFAMEPNTWRDGTLLDGKI